MKPTAIFHRAFWIGFFANSITNMLIQDYYGLNEYKALLDRSWIDLHWTVWLIPLIVLIIFYAKVYWAALQSDDDLTRL